MIEFKQLDPRVLSPEDVALIESGCRGAYDKANAQDQIQAALGGNAWIFRFMGDANGVIVLACGNRQERELVLTCMAGKGVFGNFPALHEKVVELCKSVGTKRLIGYVTNKGLQSLYRKRTKALPVAMLFSEEL